MNNFNLPINLKLIKSCPICNADYRQSMIQVLDESEFGVLTYVSCPTCGATLLTRFATMPQGVVGIAILTDLTPLEVGSFTGSDDLTGDDVLSIHQSLVNKELISSLKNNLK